MTAKQRLERDKALEQALNEDLMMACALKKEAEANLKRSCHKSEVQVYNAIVVSLTQFLKNKRGAGEHALESVISLPPISILWRCIQWKGYFMHAE